MRRLVLAVAASLAVAGCGSDGKNSNWLTYPGVAGHSKYFPLVSTPHDPTAVGTTVTCEGCHPGNTFAQFDCTTCHTVAATDPLHAAVTGYEHTSAACLRCHPTGSMTPPPDHDAIDFPRGAGTAHAAVGCIGCHTNLADPKTTSNFACAACHAGLSGGFVTGHASVAGVDASTTSAQCLVCHGDGQTNSIALHTQFPVARGSSTHDTVCLQCHDTLRTGKPYAYAADFTGYDCLGCHAQAPTDSGHTGITGYVYASASCYGCHPTGSAMPANHDTAFFPRGAGSAHAAVTCAQCHTDLSAPANPSNFACGTCHLGLDAALVTKHTTTTSNPRVTVASSEISTSNSATCLRCHADSQVTLTSSHPSGSTGDPPHQGARCLQCHDVNRTDKTFAADFASDPAASSKLATRKGCYECHTSSPPGGD